MSNATVQITTELWRDSRKRRLISAMSYPVFWALNRPAAQSLSKAIYDFALRCNGIAINFKGKHGLNIAEEKFLRSFAGQIQGGVVFDVGANCGSYTSFLKRIAPASTIYAFEPHPATFARLRARISEPNVHLIEAALADQECEIELHDFAASGGSTQASLSRDAVALFEKDLVSYGVRCTTVDSFLSSKCIQKIDLLKIDTEGFDLSVLRGAQSAIRDKRIGVIQFEFVPANVATRVTMRDFFEALPGYEIYRLCLNGGLVPIFPYDVKRCEIYVTHNLIARPA